MKSYIFTFVLIVFGLLSSKAQAKSFFFTTSDSVKLYVEIAGKGNPCVFVHGGPGSSSNYFKATGAAPQVEEKVQMIYYDQRGGGRSSSPKNNNFSLQRMLLDLEELRQFLGYQRWAVMGHSFGGTIVVPYAKQYPKSVSKLILAHVTLNINESILSHIQFGIKELKLTDSAALLNSSTPIMQRLSKVHDTLFKAGVWYKLMYRNQQEKDINDGYDKFMVNRNWDFANQVWSIQDYFQDFRLITSKITCPVLIIAGTKDYAIGPEHYKGFAFSNKKIHLYSGGHASFQEEPQWFAEKFIGFFEKANKHLE